MSIDNVPTATTTLPIYINSTNSSAISQYFTALESNSALSHGFYAKGTAGGVDNDLFFIVFEGGYWNAY